MAFPFSVPLNISKGTAVADGYRIAPPYSTLGSTGVDSNGLLISDSSYDNLGPGMLTSPIATYNITPYPTTAGNIVAATAVPAEGWLTLAGDNDATTLVASSNKAMFPAGAPNNFYLQLDWPRVPSISVVGADLAGPTNVTFFGFDRYDKPLQHTYVVQAQGIYPHAITNTANVKGKAFYKITGVYFNGATPAGGTIVCQASNTFGLPFVLKQYSHTLGFEWDFKDMKVQRGSATLVAGNIEIESPAAQAIIDARVVGGSTPPLTLAHLNDGGDPANLGHLYAGAVNNTTQAVFANFEISSSEAADVSSVSWSIANGGQFIVAAADTTPPSDITGDVRGLFQLPYIGETWAEVPDGNIPASFTWYVEGYDHNLDIWNAGQQPQQNGVPGTGGNNIVPPTTVVTRFGLSQYYTGVPAT